MSIRTAHSTLMHAALANISPELQTFDSIISLHSRHNRPSASRKTILSLPTEMLLHIRFYLIPTIIDHLRAQSAIAQSQYESSLRSYLCNECVAYNEEIFGEDVWEWAPFSGPCGCLEAGNRRPSPTVVRNHEPATLNVKEFTNPHHWLESHLSCKALRLVGSGALTGPDNPTASPIWNLVHKVLRDLGCESLRGKTSSNVITFASPAKDSPPDASVKGVLSRWDYRSKTILVVPTTSALRQAEQVACPNNRTPSDSAWRRDVILRKVERELGLAFDYPEVLEPVVERKHLAFPLIRTLPHSTSTNSPNTCSPPFISPIKARLFWVVRTLYAILSAPATMRIF